MRNLALVMRAERFPHESWSRIRYSRHFRASGAGMHLNGASHSCVPATRNVCSEINTRRRRSFLACGSRGTDSRSEHARAECRTSAELTFGSDSFARSLNSNAEHTREAERTEISRPASLLNVLFCQKARGSSLPGRIVRPCIFCSIITAVGGLKPVRFVLRSYRKWTIIYLFILLLLFIYMIISR